MGKPPRTARYAAWQLHRQVWSEGAYANLVWPGILSGSRLSAQDSGFATELAYGSLRRYGQWVRILERASGRTEQTIQPEVWWVLILGTHQLLAMATPAHAAVNEMVTLCRELGFSRASGLVNAVLRKVAARDYDAWIDTLCQEQSDPLEHPGIRHAHPRWIVDELAHALERESHSGQLEELLASHNSPPRLQLALLRGEAGASEELTPYSPRGVFSSGDPARHDRVSSGHARVQDEGSQLATLITAQAATLAPGPEIVDGCAGPGGKAALLASVADQPIVAVEQHPHRARLVRESVAAVGDRSVTVVNADLVDYLDQRELPPGFIMLDAPCTGLGALRRRPEARWVKKASDVQHLVALQRRLLVASVDALAPGGILVYITCSPVVAETTDQIDWVLASNPSLEALDTEAILQQVARRKVPGAGVGKAVQLWPHRHGTDAMFIQVLRKNAAQ